MDKPFKDGIYEEWENWMLNSNDALGLTAAGNRKHPTRPNVLDWVQRAWKNIREGTILKTVPKVHMQAEPGEPVEGYEDAEIEGAEEVIQ